jgi:hypothetical protein
VLESLPLAHGRLYEGSKLLGKSFVNGIDLIVQITIAQVKDGGCPEALVLCKKCKIFKCEENYLNRILVLLVYSACLQA